MSIQKLTKMERKYRILQQEQNAILKRMQEEKRNAKKRLESERYNYIIQVVKIAGRVGTAVGGFLIAEIKTAQHQQE